jgi:transposase-like protein
LSLFKRRRFPVDIILLCVRWYCKYGISYRDLAEMMQERGVNVDPSTLFFMPPAPASFRART